MKRLLLLILFVFGLLQIQAFAQCYDLTLCGPTSVTVGQSATYTYTDDVIYSSYSFTVVGGTLTSKTRSGYVYTAVVNWTAAGTGSVTFVNEGETLSVNVAPACSAPPAPTATFGYTNNCGNSVISIISAPSHTETWYWQTSSIGTSTSNSSTSYTVTASGTYYLRSYLTCSGWGSSQATSTVTVNVIPSPPSVTNITTCQLSTFPLSGTPGANANSINWYYGASGGPPFAQGNNASYTDLDGDYPTNSTYYYYAASINTTSGCESARQALAVTFRAVPSSPTVTNGTVCGSGATTLSATVGSGYTCSWYGASWFNSPGTPLLGSSPSFTTPNLSTTTTYYVRARQTSTGCESVPYPVTATVTAPPAAPSASASPASFCGGGASTLSATTGSGGSSVYWYSASSGGNLLSTSNSYSAPNITTSTTYYAASVNSAGCQSASRTPITVTVNPEPLPSGLSAPPICGSGSSVITGSPGAFGTTLRFYNGASTNSTLLTTGSSYTVAPTATTYYYVASYNSQTGCETFPDDRYFVAAVVSPIPNAWFSPSQLTICSGSNPTITVNTSVSGTNLSWTAQPTNATIPATSGTGNISGIFTNTDHVNPGSVIYTITPSNGVCTGTPATATVTIKNTPAMPSVTGAAICRYGTGTLSATVGVGGDALNWYGTSTGGTAYRGASLTITDPEGDLTTTNYYVSTVNTTTGCESPRKVVTLTVNSAASLPGLPASVTNGNTCGPGTALLSAVVGSNGDDIHWRDVGLQLMATGTSYSPNVSQTTTYYAYSYSSSTGCESMGTLPVIATVNTTPTANVSPGTVALCSGTSTTITVSNPNNVSGTTLSWSATTNNATAPATSGTGNIGGSYTTADGFNQGAVNYSVTPSTVYCTGTSVQATVIVNSAPVPPAPGSFIGHGNSSVNLQVAVPSGAQANWYPDLTTSTPLSTSPNFSYAYNSTYPQICVSLKDMTSLCETARVPVSVSFLPTIIPNSITTEIVRVTGQTTEANVIALNTSQKTVAISFKDGLLRTNQNVVLNATSSGKDLVTPIEYDSYGRTSKDYLTYSVTTSSAFQNTYATDQATFYTTVNDKIADDGYPYALANYEASPLGRLIEQGHEGQAWQPGTHSKKIKYSYNTGATASDQDEVRQFATDGSSTGFYAANTLSKVTMTDENGNIDITFTNSIGKVVARKQQQAASTWLQTYYVYDEFNRIKYIISPVGQAALKSANWALGQPILDDYIFQFVFDNRDRVIQKKTPGQAWTYFVYNKLNRLILVQDGNLRQLGKWSFIKYDVLGRVVMSGLYVNSSLTDQTTAQTFVNGQFGGTNPYNETPGSTLWGYSNQSFPKTNADNSVLEIWGANYYDSYSFTFNNGTTPTYDNSHLAGLPAIATSYTKGKLTGSRKLILATSTEPQWIVQAVFYDNNGRVIQIQGNNHLNQNGLDKTSTTYDFEKSNQTKTTHSPDGVNVTTIVQTPVYDAQGRVSQVTHSINGASSQILAQYNYNELGQLVQKQLHNTTGTSYLQNVDYRYNIRGWLSSINNAQLASDGGLTNNDANDYFGMEFLYNVTQAGLNDQVNDKVYYNGNISAIKWKGAGATSGGADQNSYKFGYDQSDRLTTSTFQRSTSTDWSAEAGTLNEVVTHDLNGNILTLTRNQNLRGIIGHTITNAATPIDQLTYTYATGNQLSKVEDSSGSTAGFVNGTSATAEYTYDTHGNLLSDQNKGISSIVYNALGKPTQMTVTANGTTTTIAYVYDANGNRLSVTNTVSGVATVTDYAGGFVYNTVSSTRSLSFFSSPEGRVVKNGSGNYEYQYAIADHQGNTRVLFTSATPVAVPTIATFEGDANDQSSQFSNVSAIPFGSANYTTGGSKVVRLNQATPVGPGLSKKVFPGDKVDMEVWSYYEASSGYGTSNAPLTAIITSVASALVANTGGIDGGGLKSSGVSSALNNFGAGANQGDSQPAAFLNYILFDANYKVMDAGWQLAPAGSVTKQQVVMPTVTVKEPGYIFVYLSYEDQSNNYVYFDDFKVTVTPTAVVQSNEYYPFGMQTARSWTRDNSTNNFLYNEGSELNNTTAMYDLPFRNYDAALGRFFQVDLLAAKNHPYSPYAYAINNPVSYNDPTGLDENVEDVTGPSEEEGSNDWGNTSGVSGPTGSGSGGNTGEESEGGGGIEVTNVVINADGSVTYTVSSSGYEYQVTATSDGYTVTNTNGGGTNSFIQNSDGSMTTLAGNTLMQSATVNGMLTQDDVFGFGREDLANSYYTKRGDYVRMKDLLGEFLSGTGPERSLFYGSHPLTQGMMNSAVVDRAKAFYAANYPDGGDMVRAHFDFFATDVPFVGSDIEQFIGSARMSIYQRDGLSIFVLDNTTGRYSGSFDTTPDIPRVPGETTPMGNIYQRFIWIEGH